MNARRISRRSLLGVTLTLPFLGAARAGDLKTLLLSPIERQRLVQDPAGGGAG
jgi:hypothetical protein